MDKLSYDVVYPTIPSPLDFDIFLPWACCQLSVETAVIITKTILSEYVSVVESGHSKSKAKVKQKPPSIADSEGSTGTEDKFSSSFGVMHDDVINVEAIYDHLLNLVKVKFDKNKTIPRLVMKILALTIPFHASLNSLIINSGLQMEAMYEISQFLNLSNITEICLDYTFLAEANYHVLLGQNDLKHLSLAKCKINDTVLKTIATKLAYPCPASKSLSVLNLATNRITDLGAKYLAESLRTNRQLSYLNISDNMISDKGAIFIFDILGEFPLTVSELKSKRLRYTAYLKEKQEMVYKTAKDLRTGDLDKRTTKRKSIKPTHHPPLMKKQKAEKAISKDASKSLFNLDYGRAEAIVANMLGPFYDPFCPKNTEFRNDGRTYCYGNNTLCYLNIAYNNLSYLSIKKLYDVILAQKKRNRKPHGLVNVMIEGNYLPMTCKELQEIDLTLESGLAHLKRTSVFSKRKHK